jgi:hypothetical protein
VMGSHTSVLLQEFKLILTLLAIPMSDVATIFKVGSAIWWLLTLRHVSALQQTTISGSKAPLISCTCTQKQMCARAAH